MADPQKVNKWVKFVGHKIGRWKDILDDIKVDQVPLQYVIEVRYHHSNGSINSKIVTPEVKNLGDEITDFVKRSDDVKAVEFIVDIDRINADIGSVVKSLLTYSQDT